MITPFVSFVVGFHSARVDNLSQILRTLARFHTEIVRDSQIILACQDLITGPLGDRLLVLAKPFGNTELFSANFPCMQLPALTNAGVARAKADRLVILESDRILPPGYFTAALQDLRPGTQITTALIRKLRQPVTDEVIENKEFEADDDWRSVENLLGRRNVWSGNTALFKSDYEWLGGMDETYKGYGWADSDMTNTTMKAGIVPIFRPETELHLWHPPATYGTGDQKQMFLDNGLYFCQKWGVPWPGWFRAELTARRGKVLL